MKLEVCTTMTNILLVGYLIVTLLWGARLFVVARRYARSVSTEIKLGQFVQLLIIDSLLWPWMILWHGISKILEEMELK